MEKHILFVEDDASIASGLIYAMEQEGYRVTHCKNVSAAFERMEDIPFDLALLDMQLSDGVGKEIAQVMKAEQVPVIYLTVVDDEDEIVGALEDGAADYITKPFRRLSPIDAIGIWVLAGESIEEWLKIKVF